MHILKSTIEDTPLSVHSAARKCIMSISWVIHIVWWLMKGELANWPIFNLCNFYFYFLGYEIECANFLGLVLQILEI